MKTISLNVPPKVARAFEQADASVKQKAEIYINSWLDSFLSKQRPNERLRTIMEDATREAQNNGLTGDKLNDLLKDE